MKLPKIRCILLLVAVLSLIMACSDSEDSNETNLIKETQDKIAQQAIDSIKVPLDRAKAAAESANQHTRQIEAAQQPE